MAKKKIMTIILIFVSCFALVNKADLLLLVRVLNVEIINPLGERCSEHVTVARILNEHVVHRLNFNTLINLQDTFTCFIAILIFFTIQRIFHGN